MALQGWQLAEDADQSGTGWTNETNVYTSNDSDASSGDTTSWLQVKKHRFELPNGAIVRGIEVSIEGSTSSASSGEGQVDVELTKDGSSGAGTEKSTQQLGVSGTDLVLVIGSSTDLWGTTWSKDEVESDNFGVRIQKSAGTVAVDVDHVQMRIYYDCGIRGEWDVDYDNKEVTHVDSYIDYDGGSGGTAPADGDVLYEDSSQTTAKIVGVSSGSTIVIGTLAIGEEHESNFADNDSLEICSYVDFDTESNGGLSELRIGSTFAASGGTGTRSGTIRHVWSDGSTGRMWWDVTNQSGTAFTGDENIQIGGATYAAASAAEVSNVWTGDVNGAEKTTPQGYLEYEEEATAFESSSGSKRVRSPDAQHNICVCDVDATGTKATAMVVDDVEDQADSTKGRLYVIDISGTFTDNNTIEALEELDFDGGGGSADFEVGDQVDDHPSTPTQSWVVRRLIDNGDGTGTLYLEHESGGTGGFANNDALYVSGVQEGSANGDQRQRIGEAELIATSAFVSTTVQWPSSHLYTDVQDQVDELLALDDKEPMKGRVLDQQYEVINGWWVPFYSTRRLKKGEIKERDEIGGSVGDEIYTNYFHLGGLNTSTSNIYLEQDGDVLEQFWDAGSHDVLIRNKNKNVEIDSGRVTWYCRPFGDLYDFAVVSAIGLRNPVGINTFNDSNNATAYTTVRDDTNNYYHRIMVGWASHTLEFDGGSGVIEAGDVVYNSTRSEAAMVVRVPDSVTSGTDMHLAAHGSTLSTWADSDSLDLLDYVDFDAQVYEFGLDDVVDNGGGVSGTVRFVQQFGGTRGRLWLSGISGGSWSNDDPIEVGATQYATADGDQQGANTWAGAVHTSGATSDTTALLDIGQGGEQPYNVHFILDGATGLQMYEFMKFITEERAGSTTDPATFLYPNNTAVQGRLYQLASSSYGAADLNKQAPFGSFAGGRFFGARGVFISGIAGADSQNYELIDANGTTRTPPNFQTVSVTGTVNGESLAVYERWHDEPTGTVTFATSDDSITINSGGDFDGIEVGALITVTGSTNNNGTFTVATIESSTKITVEENLTDETPGAGAVDFVSNNVDRQYYTGHATNNDETDGTFEVNETIDTDLPSTGNIVVQYVNSSETYEDLYAYTSYTGSVFTLSGTLVRDYDGNARVRVPYILKTVTTDPEEVTYIYDGTPWPAKTIYRKKGIDPFEIDSTVSGSATISVIRATDGIVE